MGLSWRVALWWGDLSIIGLNGRCVFWRGDRTDVLIVVKLKRILISRRLVLGGKIHRLNILEGLIIQNLGATAQQHFRRLKNVTIWLDDRANDRHTF